MFDFEIDFFSRFAKENHSEIERRRRTKMTTFINELADLIPSCNQQTKPDKLSILRYAADHCQVNIFSNDELHIILTRWNLEISEHSSFFNY